MTEISFFLTEGCKFLSKKQVMCYITVNLEILRFKTKKTLDNKFHALFKYVHKIFVELLSLSRMKSIYGHEFLTKLTTFFIFSAPKLQMFLSDLCMRRN